jgi:prolyl 4-hydroxylase
MNEVGSADPRRLEAERVLYNGELEQAAALFQDAADAGDAVAALRSAIFAAEGFGRAHDWAAALDLLARAAELGSQDAQRQIVLLTDNPNTDVSCRDQLAQLDLQALLTPPPLERKSDVSMVGIAKGFAPARFCSWLIERAQTRVQPAYVQIAGTGERRISTKRTAHSCGIGPQNRDFAMSVLQERAARLSGIPLANQEQPNIICYEPGQHFEAHYDFTAANLMHLPEFIRSGQRIMTLVTYLNDDFTGAPTRFPKLELDLRGGVGDAVVFSNVLPDGAPDPNTLHAGMPPEAGRKWVLSQWIRERPQRLR